MIDLDEWVFVDDDLPQRDVNFKAVSVNVVALLEDGTEVVAYYRDDKTWFDEDGRALCGKERVVAWKTI